MGSADTVEPVTKKRSANNCHSNFLNIFLPQET
jgi:hypothetical protein